MGAVVCLMCAGCSWLCAWTALGRDGEGLRRVNVRVRALDHHVRRMVGRFSTSTACAMALRWKPLAEAAEELRLKAEERGLAASAEECATVLVAGCMVVCMFAGLLTWSPLGMLVATPLVACALYMRQAHAKRVQRRLLADQMPNVFRTLATALSSGHTLMQAVDYVGLHEGGPASQVFGRASLRLRCGMSAEDALSQLATELDAPGAGLMVTALTISQRTGSPLRELFQRSAVLVEQQGEFERTLAVKTAQVRLSIRIVCLLPVAMIALLSIISPDFREGIHTPSGMVCLVVGSLMDCVALLCIRSMVQGVLE